MINCIKTQKQLICCIIEILIFKEIYFKIIKSLKKNNKFLITVIVLKINKIFQTL